MNKVTTTAFLVSDVAPATTPLQEVPCKQAIEALLKTAARVRLSRSSPPRPVEACARYHGQLVSGVPFHPVVAAVHRAFADHRPLCLSPDMIWLMIVQGVANHINASAEALRSRFVRHEGKLRIRVRRDDFVKGSPENPWTEAIDEFSEKVQEHIGPACELFRPAFTTTGPVERAAAGVVLLDAMQSYFTYDMDTLCGIPAITLEGTAEDWQAVANRTEQFGSLDLEWWLKPLRAILHQFVNAVQGVVDRPFWQSLYKYHDESGGPVITGWISALFPYLNDKSTGSVTVRNPWLTPKSQAIQDDDDDEYLDDEIDDIDIDVDADEDLDDEIDEDCKHINRLDLKKRDGRKGNDFGFDRADVPGRQRRDSRLEDTADPEDAFDDDIDGESERVVGRWLNPIPEPSRDDEECGWQGPGLADLPCGLSKAPFCWEYRDRSVEMEFLDGFVGVSQDEETLALRPEIGWAVREAPATG